MMSQQEETKELRGKALRSQGALTKEDRIIEHVRTELESYFAPANIASDYNLKQKMTTDGFIDINLLLDLKLMQDLVTNRDLLIEAISRSKLLKMNTGCTMVKYMPILERNILILRDIPDNTMKEEIMTIFNNEHCSHPTEVHSDIGNHWFCRFQTEEECLATAQYLNLHGTFKGDKLHVRVKAIHDKNKADTSPQMQNASSSKSSKSRRSNAQPPQPYGPSMPYSPGQWYAYYGTGAVSTDYGFNSGGYPPNSRGGGQSRGGGRSRSKRSPAAPDQSKVNGPPSVTPPLSGGAPVSRPEEQLTASSDYPGQFDKYPMETFLEIYRKMEEKDDFDLPQTMRGRDIRIISDEPLIPCAIAPIEETKDFEDGGGRGRGRRNRKRRRKKKEMRGYYYEDDMAPDNNGHLPYDEYPPYVRDEYGDDRPYYHDYPEEHYDHGYYDEDGDEPRGRRGQGRGGRPRGRRGDRGRGGRRRRGRGARERKEDDEEVEVESEVRERRGGPGRQGRGRRRSARQYNSRRRPESANGNPSADADGGRRRNNRRSKAKDKPRQPKAVWAPKGSRKTEKSSPTDSGDHEPKEKVSGKGGRGGKAKATSPKWIPKSTKQYATNHGVYQAKGPAASQ